MKKEEVFREEIPRPYSSFINELEEENRKIREVNRENCSLLDEFSEKIRFLEQCLDNKEKVNKSMRKDNKSLRDEIRNLKEELGKITVHSNMLESENKLLKEECKARLERIKELEK